jgi:hypothetical protein
LAGGSWLNKYRNKPIVVDGIRFPSRKEATRYAELKLMERAGLVSNLRLQVTYPLEINGVKVCSYRADFVYRENGKEIVEDSKGFKTDIFRLKSKMMRAAYGIEIRET